MAFSAIKKPQLDTPPKCPMTNSFRCSLTLSESFPRQSVWENIPTPTPGSSARTSPSVSEAMLWRPHARFGLVSRFYRNRTNPILVKWWNRVTHCGNLASNQTCREDAAWFKTGILENITLLSLSYLTLNQAGLRRWNSCGRSASARKFMHAQSHTSVARSVGACETRASRLDAPVQAGSRALGGCGRLATGIGGWLVENVANALRARE
jgi:hypothetical protein